MNKQSNKKASNVNNSSRTSVYSRIQKVRQNGYGTLTLVFLENRYGIEPGKRDFKSTKSDSKNYLKKSTMRIPISSSIFTKVVKGKIINKTNHEVLKDFEAIRHDYGASKFLID